MKTSQEICGFTGCPEPAVRHVIAVPQCFCPAGMSSPFNACGNHPPKAPRVVPCSQCGELGYSYLLPAEGHATMPPGGA